MICEKNKCTGCFACYNICPVSAIVMKEDLYGNIYPKVNKDKCINCGLCKKICPQINSKTVFIKPLNVYAMYSKNFEGRKNSSSGGIATIISEKIINEGGVVYGAANLFDKKSFSFLRIDKIEDLYKLKGSKYVHCYINDTFRKVKKDLELNIKVLFIGTPCQIAGLLSFLKKKYDNLITIDLICHGVSSQKLLFEEFKEFKINEYHYITFRDIDGFGIKVYSNYNNYKNNRVYKKINLDNDFYMKNFLDGNIFRKNCYSCSYAQTNRISDITLGDFWGLNKKSNIYDNENKGISLVISMTLKGNKIIEDIMKDVKWEKRNIIEAVNGNKQLKNPSKKRFFYYIYYTLYPILDYKYTSRLIMFIRKFKSKLRKFLK